ncbi:MAG: hypothetical protein E7161_01135 [Firmicutes bacterium]|nr:hypothetical protein [Bacillota bacterium]
MADICGECLKLDWNNKERWTSKDRYYCKELGKYVEPTDRSCRYYSYDRNHNKKDDGGFKPSGCSFSVIVRDILGYADDCELLSLLRSFRENVLKKDEQYLPILLEYDQVSPLISTSIQEDKNKQKFCLEFVQNFLAPFANIFKSGNIELAILYYKGMFNALKARFGFSDIEIDLNVPYEIETLGKGRIRTPKTSEC